MKKYFYILAALFCAGNFNASAAPGDTTWVQANNRAFDRGNGYGDYDTAVTFPTGSVSYRKIYMVFTLGKAACPSGSQYCGDWDYDVHNIVMTPTDTFELGRLITPYANANAPRTPFTWKQRYIFDVTDYATILKNAATMRVFYSGYSTGFTGNIRFAFVEGTPERNVIGVSRIWNGGFDYGRATSINTALAQLSKTAPTGTVSSELKLLITGHGGDDNACAEFCPNTYTLKLNGNDIATQNFWKANCGANQLYPQSGTWIYNRANWCPGELIDEYRYKLAGITAGSNYTIGLTFPPYTSIASNGNSQASYKLDGAVVYYGAYNNNVDAALVDIVAPTNAEYYYRENPMVGSPRLMMHNAGGTALTSVKIQYGVVGRSNQNYTWTGSLPVNATMEVKLPEMADLKLPVGSYNFTAKIIEANGAADANAINNEQTSTFNAAPIWPIDVVIQFKNNTQADQTKWRIEDMSGNVIASKNDCAVGLLCVDTLSLPFGKAMKFIVSDTDFTAGYWDIPSNQGVNSPHGDGLRFNGTSGYIRARRKDNGAQIPMPAEMTGNYEGNFGFGYTHYFYTGFPTSISNVNAAAEIDMQAYPNPANSKLSIYISGVKDAAGSIELVDMTGRTVLVQPYTSGIMATDLSTISNGIYQLVYKNNAQRDLRTTQRIMIAK